MTTFANAVRNQSARTENNMKALRNSGNPCVDLFFQIGASRGKDVIPLFTAAYVQNREVALRIAQWARDIRGGSGERKVFRDILNWLEKNDADAAQALLRKVPELGRWDDVLAVETAAMREFAFSLVQAALQSNDGLCAKWMPRKGDVAVKLREFLKLSPKQYRKLLVERTKVVETQMCAKDWDNINFSHVPSVAAARYKKAFFRHTPKYAEYVAELQKPVEQRAKGVKVSAGAVYPYDVLKGKANVYGRVNYNATEEALILAQWEALPNYMGDANILPLVDVSGSMTSPVGGYGAKNNGLTNLDVAVSLGLYCADKNTGKFKDTFLTFSGSPELVHLKGNILNKVDQMARSKWAMNTNLHAAFEKILSVARAGGVTQEEMPAMLLILSDMQFDQCVQFDDSAIEMIRRKYEAAGYTVPQVVFWNLNAKDNAPVKFNEKGVALVSGFSPNIVKTLLCGDLEEFTPEAIMMKTVMIDRYDI